MLRDKRLPQTERSFQVAHAGLAMTDSQHDLQANRLPQSPQETTNPLFSWSHSYIRHYEYIIRPIGFAGVSNVCGFVGYSSADGSGDSSTIRITFLDPNVGLCPQGPACGTSNNCPIKLRLKVAPGVPRSTG